MSINNDSLSNEKSPKTVHVQFHSTDDDQTNDLIQGTHRLSAAHIDVDKVNKSLARVNPFQLNKRKSVFFEKQHATVNQTLLVLQITASNTSDDDSIYLNLTLRELLNVILVSAKHHDEILQVSEIDIQNSRGNTTTNVSDITSTETSDTSNPIDHKPTTSTVDLKRVISETRRSISPGFRGQSNKTPLINRTAGGPMMIRTPSFQDARYPNERLPSAISADRSNVFISGPHSHLTPLPTIDDAGREIEYNAVNILRLRDLRRLDFLFNPVDEANVIVRRHVVLLSFDPIRALIMSDKLLLIVPDGADSLLQTLRQYMTEWKERHAASVIDGHDIPFESHAYEALLTTVTSIQTQEYEILKKEVEDTLSYFKSGAILPVEKQEKMRSLKNSVNATKSRTMGHKRVLLELMDDDEVMALMNLSKLRNNPRLYKSPLVPEILTSHEDIEELLETFLMDYNSLESKLEHLRVQIQSAEELVSLRLDTSRNELLVANTAMAVLACCIGFNAYITGIFGMNLDNTMYIQPVPGIFATVFGTTFTLIFVAFYLIILYYTETGVLPKRVPRRTTKQKK